MTESRSGSRRINGLVRKVAEGDIRNHRHSQYDSLELMSSHSVFGYIMCLLQEMQLKESRVSPGIAKSHITSTIEILKSIGKNKTARVGRETCRRCLAPGFLTEVQGSSRAGPSPARVMSHAKSSLWSQPMDSERL